MINYNGGDNMKKHISLIVSIVLIVVGCLVYFGYRYMTPKKVLIRTLESYKKTVFEDNKNSDNMEKILSKDYKALDISGKMTYINQNIGIDIKYNEDTKDKISQIKYDLDVNNSKLSGDLVSTNKKLYIMIKDVFEKYYYIDMDDELPDDYINFLKIDEELDIEKVIDLYIDSIDENISNSNFNSSKETITLDGKKIKTKKYTINYDKKLNDKIFNTFIKKVKNNEDASITMSKILGVEEKELDKTFEKTLKELKDEEDYSYNLSVYTKLNKTYLIEIEKDKNSIAINKDKDTYNFIIKSEDSTITGKVLTHNKDKVKIEAKLKNKYYSMDIDSVTDVTKSSSKEIIMKNDTIITSMGQKMDFDFDITIKEGEKIDSSIIKDAEDMDNISQKEEYALGTLDLFDSMISAES